MNKESNDMSLAQNIAFPLTLSEAIRHLAKQKTEIMPNCETKRNQMNNKIWQQLSVRLQLIFKGFYKTLYRTNYEVSSNEDNIQMIVDCYRHDISTTRLKHLEAKRYYIYCAVTMFYIQHNEFSLSSIDIPQKWLQQKNKGELDLRIFSEKMERVTDIVPTTSQESDVDIKSVSLDGVPIQRVIRLLKYSEKIVNTTYDYIKKNCISYQKLRGFLPDINDYSNAGVYDYLYHIFRQLDIEKKLCAEFAVYNDFYKDFILLESIYDKAPEFIESSSMEIDLLKHPSLMSVWDDISQTKTEVSPLEFEFFSYLLDSIPPRKKGEKKNITNQLSYGKWDVLPMEVRNKIIEYIIQMSNQPTRIARFLCIETSDDDIATELIGSKLKDVCLQIRFPHRYNAYSQLKELYSSLVLEQEIFRCEKLDENIDKISEIWKELQKASKES